MNESALQRLRLMFTGGLIGGTMLYAMPLSAQDAPTTGLLYNTRESSSITYYCRQVQGGLLSCEFTQTAVRKQAHPSELEAVLTRAREAFRTGERPSADQCKSNVEMLDILDGRKKAPKQWLEQTSDLAKSDVRRFIEAMSQYCKSPTEENYLGIARLVHERETRTCNVSAHTFEQTFQLLLNTNGRATWVNRSTPEGSCGIVQLNRFEAEQPTNTKLLFWSYIARKAVTNPQGTVELSNLSCKGLDESEYLYDWRSRELPLGCDYINFTAL